MVRPEGLVSQAIVLGSFAESVRSPEAVHMKLNRIPVLNPRAVEKPPTRRD